MTSETILRTLKSILAEINESENAVCYLTSEDSEVIESAIKALEQEPKTEWIPVSEKLPKKNEWVLVTFKLANGENSIDIKRINQWNGQWEDEIDIAYSKSVIAWQPLPKPYKESEEI